MTFGCGLCYVNWYDTTCSNVCDCNLCARHICMVCIAAELWQRELTCIQQTTNCRLFVVPIRLYCDDVHAHTTHQHNFRRLISNKSINGKFIYFCRHTATGGCYIVFRLLLLLRCCVCCYEKVGLTSRTKIHRVLSKMKRAGHAMKQLDHL